MNKRIIVCGIVSDGNKILLGKKEKGRPPYPDVWHTLGGGIQDLELGEKLLEEGKLEDIYFQQELKRELEEEANIQVKNIKNICPDYRVRPRTAITKDKNGEITEYIFLEFLCDLESSLLDSKSGDDIAQLLWVTKKDVNKIKLTPPSLEMYKELGWIKN